MKQTPVNTVPPSLLTGLSVSHLLLKVHKNECSCKYSILQYASYCMYHKGPVYGTRIPLMETRFVVYLNNKFQIKIGIVRIMENLKSWTNYFKIRHVALSCLLIDNVRVSQLEIKPVSQKYNRRGQSKYRAFIFHVKINYRPYLHSHVYDLLISSSFSKKIEILHSNSEKWKTYFLGWE